MKLCLSVLWREIVKHKQRKEYIGMVASIGRTDSRAFLEECYDNYL